MDQKLTKASGRSESFDEGKLYHSLRRSGASKALVARVMAEITSALASDTTTDQIYHLAHDLLRREAPHLGARYSLGRAIMALGPGGYAFETFVGALFLEEGYYVEQGVILEGRCVSHEVDVDAVKEGARVLVECKHRSQPGMRCNVKEALYVWARSDDLRNGLGPDGFREFWLITNTKFTGDAKRYAACVGLKLAGWDYPERLSIRERTERHGIHPLTCLTTLSGEHKQSLLGRRIVLARQLAGEAGAEILTGLGVLPGEVGQVQSEVEHLIAGLDPQAT